MTDIKGNLLSKAIKPQIKLVRYCSGRIPRNGVLFDVQLELVGFALQVR